MRRDEKSRHEMQWAELRWKIRWHEMRSEKSRWDDVRADGEQDERTDLRDTADRRHGNFVLLSSVRWDAVSPKGTTESALRDLKNGMWAPMELGHLSTNIESNANELISSLSVCLLFLLLKTMRRMGNEWHSSRIHLIALLSSHIHLISHSSHLALVSSHTHLTRSSHHLTHLTHLFSSYLISFECGAKTVGSEEGRRISLFEWRKLLWSRQYGRCEGIWTPQGVYESVRHRCWWTKSLLPPLSLSPLLCLSLSAFLFSSLYASFLLSWCLSVCLSSLCLSVWLCVCCLCVFVCAFCQLSVCMSIGLSVCLSVCLFFFLCCLSVCFAFSSPLLMSLCLFVSCYHFVCLSVWLLLSVNCLSVFLSVSLFVCFFVCLFDWVIISSVCLLSCCKLGDLEMPIGDPAVGKHHVQRGRRDELRCCFRFDYNVRSVRFVCEFLEHSASVPLRDTRNVYVRSVAVRLRTTRTLCAFYPEIDGH